MHDLILGIDLGGTFIKACLLDSQSRVVHATTTPTQAAGGLDHVFARMVALVDAICSDAGVARERLAAIGLGVPGPLSHAKGIIHAAPNLPGWVNVPLRARFAEATGLPVNLENDANAAAFGEFVAGAGREVRDMVLLTLGTGVGGGILVDGHLHRGAFDNAGEIGHVIVRPQGRPCPCGQRGCLERYASATAVRERYAELAGDAAPPLHDAAQVLGAATSGNHVAAQVWNDACEALALACVNLQHTLNPERIVMGGGMAEAGEALLQPVREHFRANTWNVAPDMPQIVAAALGGDAGMIGAAALARGALTGR